jgi:hypothetical protein
MQAEIDFGTASIDEKGNVSINTDTPEAVSFIRGIVGLKRFVHNARTTGELRPEEEAKIQATITELNKLANNPNPESVVRRGELEKLKSVTISPTEEQFARVLQKMRREDRTVPSGEAGRRAGGFFMRDKFGRAVHFRTKTPETPEQTIQRRGVFPYGKVPEGIRREDIELPSTRNPGNDFIFEALDAAFPQGEGDGG